MSNLQWRPLLPQTGDPTSKEFTFGKYFFQIKYAQHPKPPTPVDTPQAKAFDEWLKKSEIECDSCEYCYFYTKDGFKYPGLIATKDIPKYTAFIKIKSNLLMINHVVYFGELKDLFVKYSNIFSKEHNTYNNFFVLFVYLLYEFSKKEKSIWYPMLNNWPSDAGICCTWTLQELEELQDEYAMHKAINEEYLLSQYFDIILKIAGDYPQYFKPEVLKKKFFEYVWEMIMSRTFYSFQDTIMFSPFAELMNHENVNICFDTNVIIPKLEKPAAVDEIIEEAERTENKLYEYKELIQAYKFNEKVNYREIHPCKKDDQITINKEGVCKYLENAMKNDMSHYHYLYTNEWEFKKGEQIFLSYGDVENSYLLNTYGFCLEYNIYEFAELPLTHLKDPKKIEQFTKLFKITDIASFIPQYYAIKIYFQFVCINLLKYARLLVFGETDANTKIDYKIEKQLLLYSIGLLNDKINSYPTTIQQDLEILNGKTKSSKHYMALIYRSWKKRILHNQVLLLSIAAEIVERLINGVGWDEAMKQTKIENGLDEFSVSLNRKMIENYMRTLKIN